MDEPTIGIHPEGDKGFWVFRIAVPGIGQISRGEVTVNTTLAEEELPIEVQKATALEKVKVLAEIVVKAATRPADAHGT
jgi:hypothetical protein